MGLEQEGAEELGASSRATPGGLTSERRLSLLLRSRLCGLQWLILAMDMHVTPWKYCAGDPFLLAYMGTFEDKALSRSDRIVIAWK